MSLFWRRKALLAKIETTYGTDITPTGASDAILATNVQITPMDAQEVSRDLERPYFGGQPSLLVNNHVSIQFDVEIAGSGAAGTAPAWGPLHRACGLAETVTAGTSVDYDPVSTGQESCTIYLNIDGVHHALLGARGSLSAKLAASGVPRWTYKMQGLFVAPSAVALPTVDLTKFIDPLAVTKANTPTFTLDGYSAVMSEFDIDLQNQVEGRFLVGQEAILITDRKTTGSCSIEAPALGTKDFFGLATARSLVALSLTQGTVAGNIVSITAPKVQIGKPAYNQVQGIAHLTLPLSFTPTTAGDDEFKISVT